MGVYDDIDPERTERVLVMLRRNGVARATFLPNGRLESVELAPEVSSKDEPQHEASKGPTKRVSATGGLVPRAVDERQ